MPVTKYRAEARVVQKPVVRTEYQDRPVTAYRPVTIQQTAEVPAVTYQQVTECRPVTANNSYWRTAWQPVPKMHPLQYDPSPTLLGEMNRWSYATRMAFTPNFIPRREFVPNVVAYNAQIYKRAGLNPSDPPQTEDEMIAHARAIKDKAKVYGFMPNVGTGDPGAQAMAVLAHELARNERDPSTLGIEPRISLAKGTADAWKREFDWWRQYPITHLTINTMKAGYRDIDEHLEGLRSALAALAAG